MPAKLVPLAGARASQMGSYVGVLSNGLLRKKQQIMPSSSFWERWAKPLRRRAPRNLNLFPSLL